MNTMSTTAKQISAQWDYMDGKINRPKSAISTGLDKMKIENK